MHWNSLLLEQVIEPCVVVIVIIVNDCRRIGVGVGGIGRGGIPTVAVMGVVPGRAHLNLLFVVIVVRSVFSFAIVVVVVV